MDDTIYRKQAIDTMKMFIDRRWETNYGARMDGGESE